MTTEQAEAKARQNGYTGPWPPRAPRIESATDCEHYLIRLEQGEVRAGHVRALTKKLPQFTDDLTPKHFGRFVRTTFTAAGDHRHFHRSRLRAVMAPTMVVRALTECILRLEADGAAADRVQHHARCLVAALGELSRAEWEQLGHMLSELIRTGVRDRRNAGRTLKAMTAMINDSLQYMLIATAHDAANPAQ